MKAHSHGVAMRGSIANGLSYGLLFGAIAPSYDFLKEYYYFFFGPAHWLRPSCLFAATLLGTYISMPFENIKTRMHVMSALPDGRMPYTGVWDCFKKICVFESNHAKYSTYHAFHNGFVPYFLKVYISLLIGVYVSDHAFKQNYQEDEFIERGDYFRGPYVKDYAHNPINRAETNIEILSVEPKKTYYVTKDKETSFKF